MRTICILAFLALPACSQDAFRPLFDGKTLDGWDGDSRLWSVRDGAIVGSTDKTSISHNSFLIYRKSEFSNFELQAEAKLRNHNSGIQFRSEALEDYVVRGYQADMAEGNWWGSIYDEKGTRGVLVNGWKGKAEKVVKPTDWNSIDVTCNGDHIQVRVNGLLTADLHDSARLSGIIALQLHMGPPMEVEFRNIRIKELH
jgi:hypothetical protein